MPPCAGRFPIRSTPRAMHRGQQTTYWKLMRSKRSCRRRASSGKMPKQRFPLFQTITCLHTARGSNTSLRVSKRKQRHSRPSMSRCGSSSRVKRPFRPHTPMSAFRQDVTANTSWDQCWREKMEWKKRTHRALSTAQPQHMHIYALGRASHRLVYCHRARMDRFVGMAPLQSVPHKSGSNGYSFFACSPPHFA